MLFFPKTNKPSSFDPTKTLTTLANELETDKGTANRDTLTWGPTWGARLQLFCWGYTTTYEKYMNNVREKDVKFLEIGVCDGRFPYASPKMWLKFFKNVELYCTDNFWNQGYEQEIKNIEHLNNLGANFIYADQYSEDDWNEIEKIIGNDALDFIVEDGSHFPEHMMYSLWRSINILKPGGYYFMEDIQNPNKTRGMWGYDNADIVTELTSFLETKQLKSKFLESDKTQQIIDNLEIVELKLDPSESNYISVFRKK